MQTLVLQRTGQPLLCCGQLRSNSAAVPWVAIQLSLVLRQLPAHICWFAVLPSPTVCPTCIPSCSLCLFSSFPAGMPKCACLYIDAYVCGCVKHLHYCQALIRNLSMHSCASKNETK